MYGNLKTLKELCIDCVCNNKECLFIKHNTFLPKEMSETLLTKLSLQNKLDDETLSYFNEKNVYLRNVILPVTKNVTPKGLRSLNNHNIKRLEVCSFKYPINLLVNSLSKRNIDNIETLCVPNITFNMTNIYSRSRDLVTESFSKFKNVRFLDVSDSVFSTPHLFYVLKDLHHLESLNISNTNVDSLLPFGSVESKLRILNIYNLKCVKKETKSFAPLKCLTSLTHLDLSFDSQLKSFSYKTLMDDPSWLPNLVSLDISGSDDVGSEILKNFLNTHQNLKYLGLLKLDDCALDMFTNSSNPLFNTDLLVSGSATEEQLVIGLKLYKKRPFFIHDCLNFMFKMTENFNSPKVEIIQLILDVMHIHSDEFLVQTSATACLYNLTKFELTSKIHPSVLIKVVEATLYAMERFPNVAQLQSNALLILCNGNILLNLKLDNFKCAKLVLDTLNLLNDDVLNPISIIIFCTLAPNLSFSEPYHQEYHSGYLDILISKIVVKVTREVVDATMKLILIALWCLTGESSITCELFIDKGGLHAYKYVLEAFIDDGSVNIKVLGVLKNIAEVPHLRTMLLIHDLIPYLRNLLRSEQIIVSYCAAEIIAHLACESSWEAYTEASRDETLKHLRFTIKHWIPPDVELIVYRSFESFIGLLNSTDTTEVQLFVTWAIHHACTNNANKYCAILNEEIGTIFFQNISSDESVDQEVRELCDRIINMMNNVGKV